MVGFFARVVVQDGSVALLFRDGVLAAELPPGRHAVGRRGTTVPVSVRPQVMSVQGQETLSADGFAIRVTAAVVWRIVDARAAWAASASLGADRLYLATQLALREIVGGRAIDALVTERPAMDAALAGAVHAAAPPLGHAIEDARIRDLALPADARRLLTEPERARREGLAALERARAEHAALRLLANAARSLRNNPELQHLRLLQVLAGSPGRSPPTLVLGQGVLAPLPTTGAPHEDAPED